MERHMPLVRDLVGSVLTGKAFNKWLHTLMREESGWAVGERELFAAFTSKCNQCPF